MSNLNKVMLIGRVGQDPELRYTTAGKAVINVSLATSEKWGRGEDKQERTSWHKVVMWDKIAETYHKYLHKGKLVYIEGRLDYKEYEKEGVRRTTAEVVAQNVILLDSARAMTDRVSQGSLPLEGGEDMRTPSGQDYPF